MNKIILLLLCILSATVKASSHNNTNTIKVEADAVMIDEIAGMNVYTGGVVVTHRNSVLSAEKIQLFNNQTKVIKMVAIGNKKHPARYQHRSSNQPSFVDATALNITYLIKNRVVRLTGNVYLIQKGISFSGNTIDYNIANGKIIDK